MTLEDLRARVETAVKRRDEVVQQHQRLMGRLDEAQRALEQVRAKCRAKNIDPDKIDDVVAKLEEHLTQQVSELERVLGEAETALAPFKAK